MGSTVALTDGVGAVTTTYDYSPFGATSSTGSSANQLQYTGREHDETGLYYYRARYYSAQSARFVSEDPLLNSKAWSVSGNRPMRLRIGNPLPKTGNAYRYVDNNPLKYVDPLGLEENFRCVAQCQADSGMKAAQCAANELYSATCTVVCVAGFAAAGAIGGGVTGVGVGPGAAGGGAVGVLVCPSICDALSTSSAAKCATNDLKNNMTDCLARKCPNG